MKIMRLFVLLSFILAAVAANPAQGAGLVGKEAYLQTNLWFENPKKIFSTNYHKGVMLPAGTRVRIKLVGYYSDSPGSPQLSMDEEQMIVFQTVADKVEYRIRYVSKHHGKVSVKELAEMYFKETDPLKSAAYAGFSQQEKDAIRRGVIEKGMSKEAVLMSYGYPPHHRTPSVKYDTWIYWHSRYVRKLVQFYDNGRVYRIQ